MKFNGPLKRKGEYFIKNELCLLNVEIERRKNGYTSYLIKIFIDLTLSLFEKKNYFFPLNYYNKVRFQRKFSRKEKKTSLFFTFLKKKIILIRFWKYFNETFKFSAYYPYLWLKYLENLEQFKHGSAEVDLGKNINKDKLTFHLDKRDSLEIKLWSNEKNNIF